MTEFPEAYVTPGLGTLEEEVVGAVEAGVLDCMVEEEINVEVARIELMALMEEALEAVAELLAAAADDMIDAYPIRMAPWYPKAVLGSTNFDFR